MYSRVDTFPAKLRRDIEQSLARFEQAITASQIASMKQTLMTMIILFDYVCFVCNITDMDFTIFGISRNSDIL